MKKIKTREELQIEIKQLNSRISELENTENKSSACLENSPVCTKIIDLDFNLQYMSNAGIRALQIDDVSTLYGKPYPLSFFPDAYKIAMSKDLLRVKETGKTIIQEGEILDVKGNKLWFQATITPVYNEQGEIDHIMVVSLDASDSKQAKDELLKSEKKYRELVNRAQEGIWVIDKDNATSFVNPSMARMLGYSEKEMLGKSLFDFMDETGIKIANENLERRQVGIKDQHDFEFICKNGERMIASLETAPIMDEDGNYDGAIAGVMNITERKKIEEVLSENELFLKQTQEISKVGGWSYNVASGISKFTDETARIYGLSIGDIPTTEDGIKFYHPDDREAISVAFSKAITEGKPYDLEVGFINEQGDNLFVRTIGTPIFENGKVIKLTGAILDISERKKAEEHLKESETKFRALFEQAGGYCMVLDPNTQDGIPIIIDANEAACLIHGYTKNELIGKRVSEIDNEEGKLLVKKRTAEIMTGKPFYIENTHVRKNGATFTVAVNAKRIDIGNAPPIIFTIEYDITERVIAERALKESEERFRNAINYAPYPMMIHSDGKVLQLSEEWIKQTGYTIEDIPTIKKWSLKAYGKDVDPNNDFIENLYKIESTQHDGEWKVKLKDGSYRFWDFSSSLIGKLPTGKKLVISMASDITERKLTEEKLKESEKRFRAMYNNTPAMLHSLDENGLLISVSDFWLKTLGYEKSEVLGKPSSMFLTDSSKRYARDIAFPKFRDNDYISNVSYQFVKKNGEVIDVLLSAIAIRDNSGKMNRSLAVLSDITDRKKAEEALLVNQKRYKDAEAIGHVGNWEYDPVATTFWASDEARRIYGFDLERKDFTTEKVESCIIERERVHQALIDLIEHDKKYDLVFDILTVDKGIRKTVHSIAEIERDAHGNPSKISGVVSDITRQKKADIKLKESEERFRKLIDNMPSGVAIYKALDNANDFEFIDINKKAEEITNTSNKEIIGHSLLETFPNMKNGPFVESLTKVSRTGFDIYLPPFFYKDDKRQGWRENNIYKLASGEIVAIFKDVTDLKEAEEQLKKQNIELLEAKEKAEESNERFNLAMTAAKDGLYDWNLVTNEIYYSPGWKSMLGYGDDELPNDFSVWEKLIEVEDLEKSRKMQQELINKQRDRFELEFKMNHKDGHWVDILSRADVMFDENNKAIRMVGTHVDISERKKAEGVVRRLSTAVQQSPSIVLITDTEGIVEYINPKFSELTGYSITEAIGQNSNILKSGKQDFAFYKDLWKTIESGKVWRGQFRNKKKNGDLFWEASSISAILNESGDIINYIKIGEDITLQKQTEIELKIALEKALESDRLKSAFLANMSHEIRTPMNGILGFINLLNEPDLSKVEIEEYSAIINRGGKRLLTTINDIIDISRIESGEMVVSKEETALSSMMDELYSFYSPEAKLKGLSLLLKPATEQLTIITDSQKLHGILTNLIKNAIKFTEEGSITFGYVFKKNTVLNEQPGSSDVEFFVEDTGTGIPKDRIRAIFKRFEQADIEDTKALEGSGLGLAISTAYIEMLGGEIFVESEQGKGSRFTFTIPYIKK